MSDDELIARLRDFDPHLHEWEVVDEAADRIKQLVAKYDEAVECNEEFFVDNQILKERVARLDGALKGLVEHCEVTRDTAGFWKSRQTHQVSPTQWQSWCKQIKTARAALTDGGKDG